MDSYSTNRFTALDDDRLRSLVPAIFATDPSPRTSTHYTFIRTHQVIGGLRDTGFTPVQARQSAARKGTPDSTRHIAWLRTSRSELTLVDAIPEVVLLSAHDGSSTYVMLASICHLLREVGGKYSVSDAQTCTDADGDTAPGFWSGQ